MQEEGMEVVLNPRQWHGIRLLAGDSRQMRGAVDWQILSFWIAESVIPAKIAVTPVVTITRKFIEKKELGTRRTSDFRHLGLWHSECDS